ncbi:MAG TPA: YggS family pyridoxal phosphate-dependent enzyme [Deltaproteobacteria bacterium]|nr:YggS family pyridoxal phosphate-dependent enzyme [Deltaproteobacteria bacterium]
MNSIEDSVKRVQEKIGNACARAGRNPSGVRLIAVTKTVDQERIQKAVSCGIKDFGENYVQEAKKKIEELPRGLTWHMIGYIQTNKIKFIPKLFHYIHSADRWEVLERLDQYEKPLKVLFEMNISGESSKHGTTEEGLKKILEKIHTLKYIKPVGLMTMAPYTEKSEGVRNIFRTLREILSRVNREFNLDMNELSMGMSSDFEVAIEEGATMVRIGTALFGERQ